MTVTESSGPAVAAGDARPVPSDRVRWALYGVTVVPFATAVVRAIATGWFPIGDSALLYLRAADVGTRHHPWLGSWSSASRSLGRDINNPGPLHADLIAPFAHVFPPGIGNAIGVATVNVLALVLAALIARRVGGRTFEAWVLLVGGLLAWSMGSELLFDMFQAHALLFPFLCGLVLLVGAMCGDRATWPWLVLVWSLILQTHVSYAYIAIAIVVVAIAVTVPSLPRRGWPAGAVRARPFVTSVVVGVVVWVQPLLEQLLGPGEGNLSRLARSAGGADVAVGFGNAFRMVSAVVALPPWWSRAGFADTIRPAGTVDGPDGPVVEIPWLPHPLAAAIGFLVVLALLVAAVRWAVRHEDRLVRAMLAIALAGLVGAVVALGRLTVGSVGLAAHHTRWLFVVALWSHATLALAGWRWWAARRSHRTAAGPAGRHAPAAVVVAAVVVALANVPKYTQQHGPLADTEVMPALERVFDRLDPLQAIDPVLYRTDNLRVYEPYSSAIMAQLVDRGIEFRVADEVMVRQLGERRRSDGSERYTLTQLQGWDAYAYDGAGCVLARVSDVEPVGAEALASAADDHGRRAAGLDVGAVATSDLMTERDRALAARVAAGDEDAIHRAVVEGWFAWWIDHGLVAGDPALLAALVDARPPLMHWVGTTFVLVVEPADGCAG